MARRRSQARTYEELEKAVNDLEDSLAKLRERSSKAGDDLGKFGNSLQSFFLSPLTGNLSQAAGTLSGLGTAFLPSAAQALGIPGVGAARSFMGWADAQGNALERAQGFAAQLADQGVPEDRIRGMLNEAVPIFKAREERKAKAVRMAADMARSATDEQVATKESKIMDVLSGEDVRGEQLEAKRQEILRARARSGMGSTDLLQGVSSAFRQMLKAGSVEAK